MSLLDHKIPPPIIALACAGLAWAVAQAVPSWVCPIPSRRVWVALLVSAGLALDVWGLVAFRKAKTTINPLSPQRSSAIVCSGPYAYTRNPMYVGMALVLLGWCVYLAHPLSLLAVALFAAYITRFQIVPEERLLLARFGEPYAQYLHAVRRWL